MKDSAYPVTLFIKNMYGAVSRIEDLSKAKWKLLLCSIRTLTYISGPRHQRIKPQGKEESLSLKVENTTLLQSILPTE